MKKLVVRGAGSIGTSVAVGILPDISEKFEEIYFFDNDAKKQGGGYMRI